jgi:hypothetical protein
VAADLIERALIAIEPPHVFRDDFFAWTRKYGVIAGTPRLV